MGLSVLDASVVIGLLDASDEHHGGAAAAIRARLAARDRLVVPTSAYAELLVGAMRRGPEAVALVDEVLARLPAEVVALDRDSARLAADLRARNPGRLRLPDAFVLATALALEADLVVTADRGWPEVVGLEVQLIA